MKRLLVVMLAILIGAVLTACAAPADVSELESRIASLETQLSEKEATITDLETKVAELEERLKEAIAPPPPVVEPAPEPTPPATFEPIVITGSGDKTSPPFVVTTNEWVVNWNYTPNPEYPEMAVFGFFVYPRGETAMFVTSVMAGMGGETYGSTYSYAGAGEYYIKVLAGNVNFWTILITPP